MMPRHGSSRGYLWGSLFIVAGAWWLLDMLGVVTFRWDFFGPLALVAVGVSMMFRGGWHCGCGSHEGHEHHDEAR